MGETGSRGWTLARSGGNWLLGNDDFRIVLQLVKAAVGNDVAWIDALDGGLAGIHNAWRDIADLGGVILDYVDKRGLAIMLNGRGRNQRDSLQGGHQQPGVYELIGKQGIVLVVEKRPQPDRTRGGIDLVVEGQEFSAGDLGLLGAIENVDR